MLALLCGGQGLISPDMFSLVADSPQAQPVFAAATAQLGCDPRTAIQQMSAQQLAANRLNQILSVTASLAHFAAISSALPERFLVAGYSVGEMAGWSIAGIWTAADALRLTDCRARAMDAANQGGRLAYVRGLDRRGVEALAADHGCALAIINPSGLVVGGPAGAILALAAACREAGGQAEPLDVHIAAHTPLLEAAIPSFEAELALTALHKPGPILLAGGNGARIFDPATALHNLATQIATIIDWVATLDALAEYGVDRILDLGPGAALQHGAASRLPDISCYAATGFRHIEGIRNWL